MGIDLFYMPPSPPSRNVLMTLRALNLQFKENVIDIRKGESRTPEYLAMNPRGKIPLLRDGNYAIAESRAIATYLCNKYEKGDDSTRLYPKDPETRGRVDQMLYVSENISDMIMNYANVGGVIFGGGKPNIDKLPGVRKACELTEGYLGNNKFIAGNHVTLADFFMSSPFFMLSLPGYTDFKDFPKTTGWLGRVKNLSYYDACNKKGMETMTGWYKEALKNNAS